MVVSCLREALEQSGVPVDVMTEDTVIVGPGAVLDSIGVVSLIVDLEQRIELDYGVAVTLASEKAMSQHSSPFKNAGMLADHVFATIKEEQTA